MHRARRPRTESPDKSEPRESLRQAFKDEIRLADYLGKAWATAFIAGLLLCAQAAMTGGSLDLNQLGPMGGHWHSRDASGHFYVETWSTILVNSIQVGLGIWGAILLALGVKRLLSAHKFFFGCFSLGITFCGFAYFMPAMSQPILQMLVDRMPFLMN